MSNSPQFLQAADVVKKLDQTPTNDEYKQLYGLYKQAKVGNINVDKPGFLDFRGKEKWDAWNECKNILVSNNNKTRLIYSTDIKDNKLDIIKYDSEVKYITLVNKLIKSYGLKK